MGSLLLTEIYWVISVFWTKISNYIHINFAYNYSVMPIIQLQLKSSHEWVIKSRRAIGNVIICPCAHLRHAMRVKETPRSTEAVQVQIITRRDFRYWKWVKCKHIMMHHAQMNHVTAREKRHHIRHILYKYHLPNQINKSSWYGHKII